MNPRILIPFDFSPAAEAALAWAAELQRARGGTLKLIHVLTFLPVVVGVGGELPLPPPPEVEIKALEADLREVANRVAPGAETEVVMGTSVGEAVLQAAQNWAPSLIAMGTHGRGGVKRLLLGSVADLVVRSAACPVLTVRGPA